MLEFALKKERIKVSQMKGAEEGNIPAPPELDGNESPSDDIPVTFHLFFLSLIIFSRKWRETKKGWAISGPAGDSFFVSTYRRSALQTRFSMLEVPVFARFSAILRQMMVNQNRNNKIQKIQMTMMIMKMSKTRETFYRNRAASQFSTTCQSKTTTFKMRWTILTS